MSFEMDRVRTIGGVEDGAWGAMSKLTFTTKVMPLFGLALLVAAGGAAGGLALFTALPAIALPIVLAGIAVEFILALTCGKWQYKEGLNKVLFFVYALLSGVTIVPLMMYVGQQGGIMMIAQALSVTTVTFLGLGAYGLTTKRDFTNMGGYIFVGCMALFFAGLLNFFFFHSSMASLAFSVFGVGIFSAFAVWEMNMIRNAYADEDYVGASLGLFIAFMGLFTSILRLFGIMGSSDD